MQSSRAVLLLLAMVATASVAAQAPAASTGAPAAPTQNAPGQAAPGQAGASAGGAAAAPATAYATLQPALNTVQNTLSSLRIDKWKRGSVRDEAGDHVTSLMHDMQNNLPPLVTAADAAPGQLSTSLPLTKHLDAFYDVLLRVEEASRVAAPGDQVTALQQALQALEQARIVLDNQAQAAAAAQEKQIADLQVALREQKAAAAQQKQLIAETKAEPCKPATPARKKRRTTAPAKKASGTGTAAGQKPAQATPKPQ